MDISQARQLAPSIPQVQQAALAAAHERYMYFTGVYTDQPEVDHRAEDRAAFSHLLAFTEDGRPSLSDERCAEFMAAVTGLPREWCLAWDEIEFVKEHGEDFVEKQRRLQASDLLEAQHKEDGMNTDSTQTFQLSEVTEALRKEYAEAFALTTDQAQTILANATTHIVIKPDSKTGDSGRGDD